MTGEAFYGIRLAGSAPVDWRLSWNKGIAEHAEPAICPLRLHFRSDTASSSSGREAEFTGNKERGLCAAISKPVRVTGVSRTGETAIECAPPKRLSFPLWGDL